jgi:hypothetical protein
MIADFDPGDISPRDREFLRSMLDADTSASADVAAIKAALSDAGDAIGDMEPSLTEDKCPACHEVVTTVALGTAKCKRGHEWGKSSLY